MYITTLFKEKYRSSGNFGRNSYTIYRRKAKDYGVSSLELGGASNVFKHVPMKRRVPMKAVKYLILILLGFILHSGYRFIMKPNSEREVEPVPSGVKIKDGVAEKAEEGFEEEDNPFFEEWKEDEVKEKLNKHAKKVFQKQEIPETKNAKVETLEDRGIGKDKNIPNHISNVKKQSDSSFPSKQPHAKHDVVDVKFKPKNDIEKKDLKNEMEIENQIAKLMDESKNVENVNEVLAEEYTDPEKPIHRDPKVQAEFQQKAEQIVRVVKRNVQNVILSEGHHGHEIPVFVTAASQQTISQVEHLVSSIQYFYPHESIYVFDLDLTDEQHKKLSALCNVHMRGFWFNLFPKFIQDLSNFHWRPLIIQTALAEFGHITWINPGFRVSSTAFSELVHRSEEPGVLLIGQSADYTTHAVTHPKMYKYLTVNRADLFKFPHIEMRAMILHNTDQVMDNFMKILMACAVEQNCLSPSGASPDCTFDVTGREYANCHRFDESAVNIILKNWLGHKPTSYMIKSTFLQPINKYDRAHPNICNK